MDPFPWLCRATGLCAGPKPFSNAAGLVRSRLALRAIRSALRSAAGIIRIIRSLRQFLDGRNRRRGRGRVLSCPVGCCRRRQRCSGQVLVSFVAGHNLLRVLKRRFL